MIDCDRGYGDRVGERYAQGAILAFHWPAVGGADVGRDGVIGMLERELGQPPPPLEEPRPRNPICMRIRGEMMDDPPAGIPGCKVREPDAV